MTPGQLILLQQLQLVAHARGWDIPKTIQKTQEVLAYLAAAQKGKVLPPSLKTFGKKGAVKSPSPPTPLSKDEAKLIAEAEAIMKESLSFGQDKPKGAGPPAPTGEPPPPATPDDPTLPPK